MSHQGSNTTTTPSAIPPPIVELDSNNTVSLTANTNDPTLAYIFPLSSSYQYSDYASLINISNFNYNNISTTINDIDYGTNIGKTDSYYLYLNTLNNTNSSTDVSTFVLYISSTELLTMIQYKFNSVLNIEILDIKQSTDGTNANLVSVSDVSADTDSALILLELYFYNLAKKLDITEVRGTSNSVPILYHDYNDTDNVYINNIILNNEILKYYKEISDLGTTSFPTNTKLITSTTPLKQFNFTYTNEIPSDIDANPSVMANAIYSSLYSADFHNWFTLIVNAADTTVQESVHEKGFTYFNAFNPNVYIKLSITSTIVNNDDGAVQEPTVYYILYKPKPDSADTNAFGNIVDGGSTGGTGGDTPTVNTLVSALEQLYTKLDDVNGAKSVYLDQSTENNLTTLTNAMDALVTANSTVIQTANAPNVSSYVKGFVTDLTNSITAAKNEFDAWILNSTHETLLPFGDALSLIYTNKDAVITALTVAADPLSAINTLISNINLSEFNTNANDYTTSLSGDSGPNAYARSIIEMYLSGIPNSITEASTLVTAFSVELSTELSDLSSAVIDVQNKWVALVNSDSTTVAGAIADFNTSLTELGTALTAVTDKITSLAPASRRVRQFIKPMHRKVTRATRQRRNVTQQSAQQRSVRH